MAWRWLGSELWITYGLPHPLNSLITVLEGTIWSSECIHHPSQFSLTFIRKAKSRCVKLTELSNLVESLICFQITWVDTHLFHENSYWWQVFMLKGTHLQTTHSKKCDFFKTWNWFFFGTENCTPNKCEFYGNMNYVSKLFFFSIQIGSSCT